MVASFATVIGAALTALAILAAVSGVGDMAAGACVGARVSGGAGAGTHADCANVRQATSAMS